MNHWKKAAALALFVCAAGPAEAQERRRTDQQPEGGPGRERLLQRFDTNKDGKLDDAERTQARKALGQRPAPRSGETGAPQHGRRKGAGKGAGEGAGRGRGKGAPPNLKALLKRFDTNKDGKLDDAEKQRARDLMKRVKEKVDVNGDGQIGPRERARGRQVLRKRREATPPPKQSGRRGREATPPQKRQVRRGGN